MLSSQKNDNAINSFGKLGCIKPGILNLASMNLDRKKKKTHIFIFINL